MSLSSCYTHSIANLDKIDITVSSIKIILLLGKTFKILKANSGREVASILVDRSSISASSWLPFTANLNLTDNTCTHRDFMSFSFCKHC